MELLNIGVDASLSLSVDLRTVSAGGLELFAAGKNHPDCLPVIIAAHALVLDDGESGASASRSTDTSIQTEAARPTGVLP